MSWLDIAFRRPLPTAATTPPDVAPPPPPPPVEAAPKPAVGMPTQDEFVDGTKSPAGPDLTGGVRTEPPLAASSTAKPASEYSKPAGVEGDAFEVDKSFRAGGPSQAAQTLADLTMQHGQEPGYADALLKASSKTLESVTLELGARTRSKGLDDNKVDAHGKLNTTYETLKNLSVVADKAGPEGLKLLGTTLAASTPDDSQLNQLDDTLKELQKEKMPGLEKLAGTLVSELRASGKNEAAKELGKEHKPLEEVSTAPPVDAGRWKPGTSLEDARNAHTTTTWPTFDKAREGDYNWFEGDVRMEIDRGGRIEMRHDEGHEDGDNLSLMEWLNNAKEQGVGVKLDVKDSQVFDNRFLEDVKASGIPDERLMFNYGFDKMAAQGQKTRAMFPEAILALNPPSGGTGEDKAARMMDMVKSGQCPPPVTFVFEYKDVPSAKTLQDLNALGTVSVWRGNTFSGKDPAEATQELRDKGVTGMVDLKESITQKVKDKVTDTLRDAWKPFPG